MSAGDDGVLVFANTGVVGAKTVKQRSMALIVLKAALLRCGRVDAGAGARQRASDGAVLAHRRRISPDCVFDQLLSVSTKLCIKFLTLLLSFKLLT